MNGSSNKNVIKILSSKERSLMTGGVLPRHLTILIGTLEIDLTIDSVCDSVDVEFDSEKNLKKKPESHSLEKFLEASKLIEELFNDKK
ncbi:hypothetical protein ABQ284_06965 [Lentilactobacillus buchneri]|uniref:hypothetical protein n=1 Tax=Lentilactobacillus buchneri TaxID=1581 RepID=UPI0030F16EDE